MAEAKDLLQVLITVKFSEELLQAIRATSDRIEVLYYPVDEAKRVLEDVWARAEVLYTARVAPEAGQAPNLRWMHVHSAGVDHILDQSILSEPEITLTTASGIHATNMAEYAFAMMLAFGHRLLTMLRYQGESRWPEEKKFEIFMPLELRGSTVGIVGYGSIGREIARLAKAFGMEVLAVKRNVFEPADRAGYHLPGTGDPEGTHFDRLYPPEALASMVRECDFVVVTAPLTQGTRNIFGGEVFAAMKPTAFLINIGRGGVVDEEALLEALQKKQIAGAALDVFEAEPLPEDNPLWKQPNVIISPHISGNTADYNDKAADLFIENLERYLAGKALLNVVDLTREY